jgi:poxvirus D5 protein-like
VFWRNWEPSNWQEDDYSSSTGYGILTERADLIVIDCDVKGDVDGLDSFLNLCYRNNYNPDKHTLSVNTPSGGRHYYFLAHQRYESGASRIRSSVSKILPGVDIRADGGYIVGFGSVIDNGSYTLASSVRAVDQVPDWLYKSLLSLQEPQQNSLLDEHRNSSTGKSMKTGTTEQDGLVDTDRKSSSVASEESGASMITDSSHKSAREHDSSSTSENNSVSAESVDWESDPYASEVLRRCVKALSKAAEGTRNKALFDKAFCCGANGVPHDKAVDALSDEAMKIGLSIGEIIRTTSRAWSEGRKKFDSLEGYRKVLSERQEWMSKNSTSGSEGSNDDVEIPSLEDSWSWSAPAMAERILGKHHIRYVPGKSNNGDWYVYSPKTGIWEKGASVKDIVTQEMKVLSRALDAKDVKQKARSVVTYRFISEITSSMKFMCNIDENEFDSSPYLRCVANGVLDLRTGQLSPYDPDLLMSKRIDVAYKPSAADSNSLLRQVLSAMPEDAIGWAQVMFGQAMFGLQPSSSVVTFMHGSGSNGKSTIINLLKETMGTYSSELSKSAFNFRSTDSKYALYQMRGVSQTILEELPKGVNLDIDTLKEIAGTETIVARGVCKDFISFENMLSVFVSTNHLPRVDTDDNTDYGTQRRLIALPFPYRFVTSETHAKNPQPNDRMASSYLTQSISTNTPLLEAFLAWRVQGAVRWWKAGRNRLEIETTLPPSVIQATNRWLKTDSSIEEFLNEYITHEQGQCIPVSNAYSIYKEWADRNGYEKMNRATFSNRITNVEGISRTTGTKGSHVSTMGAFRVDRRAVVLQGIRFATENDEAFSTEPLSQSTGSTYSSITSDNLLNDFQDSNQHDNDSAENRDDVTKSVESLEPETVQADDAQATQQKDVSETTDVDSVLPEVLQQDDEQSTINTDSISPTIEQKRIETGISVEISNNASNPEHTTAPSTQESEINGGFNHDEPVVSETDIMVLDSVLMTCSDAWENLDDLCQCYGTHNLVTPEGERLELEEILRLLYQNSMTLPDIIIAINTNREHVSRKRE